MIKVYDKTTTDQPIIRVNGSLRLDDTDQLAIEEPLEIRLTYGNAGNRIMKNISVTMRTPGNDHELAKGFLFTEGIIRGDQDIDTIAHGFTCAENKNNTINVELKNGYIPQLSSAERNFYTTSSCGVCGKGSIAAIRTASAFAAVQNDRLRLDAGTLLGLPELARQYQETFETTGGLHACSLFSCTGELALLREDVGRHNALDKLIGAAMNSHAMPLDRYVLLLSGRASFELIQKAAMAGIPVIAAIGAPSSLAVELATEFGITLVGFLRGQRFNIYSNPQRILTQHENKDQR